MLSEWRLILYSVNSKGTFMTKDHQNYSRMRKHEQPNQFEFSSRKLHKDWRVWLVVGIMLAAIIIYVLTLDDSVVPISIRN